jgi:hypothetical protein
MVSPTDIVGLRKPHERLYTQDEVTTRVCFGEIRHVLAPTPGATALTRMPRAPSIEAKCFTSVSTAPLVAAYAGIVPTTACAASDERKTMLLPSDMIGRSCCTRKNGVRTLTAKSLSKSSAVVSSIVAAF